MQLLYERLRVGDISKNVPASMSEIAYKEVLIKMIKKLKISEEEVSMLSFEDVFLKFKKLCDRLSYRWASTYPIEDLQQEAYIGLWNAFEKYDFKKYSHVLFSTLAFSYINYSHLRYHAKHRSKFHKVTSQITQIISLQQPLKNSKGDSRDGYVQVKIANPNKWKLKHELIWEASNGKRPKHHVIIFADQNRLNFDLDNLVLISRRELLVCNRRGLLMNDAQLTITGILIGKVVIQSRERRRVSKK